jgi:uncharacterized protein YbjT (DUF2867 family)
MKVLIFGATGMVGQAVLRECLLDPDVELTVAVGAPPPARSTQSCVKSCSRTWRITPDEKRN